MAFGDRLREWREAAGLTQADLARRLNLAQQTISEWEQGRAAPRRSRAADVAKLLNVDESEFLRSLADVPLSVDADPDVARLVAKVDRLGKRDRRIVENIVDELLRDR